MMLRRIFVSGMSCSICLGSLPSRSEGAPDSFLPICSAPVWHDAMAQAPDKPSGERGNPPQPPPISLYGAADPRRAWKPRGASKKINLGVCFLNGNDLSRQATISAANKWLDGDIGQLISLNWGVDIENSQIRILFDQNYNDSYIGTDADLHRTGQTMRLMSKSTLDKTDLPFEIIVQHEFGHAFGLLHEQQHQRLVINWDRDAIIIDLQSKTSWKLDEIKNYVDNFIIKRNPPESVCPANDGVQLGSIMMYPIPRHWNKDGVALLPGNKLTSIDQECVKSIYAKGAM